MSTDTRTYRPVVLIIRDGWGRNPHPEHDAFNAVLRAATPVADRIEREWPTTLVRTCGEDVGLPAGTMGNSEVGHQNIGAGRIVNQEIMRITASIRDESFFDNRALVGAFEHAEHTGGAVHLMGLASDGKVHSDLEHLFALIDLAARRHWPADRLFIHLFTDGRDTGPNRGLGYTQQVQDHLDVRGVGRIASVIGRYWAMDRDHRWERIAIAYGGLTGRPVDHPNLAGNGIDIATGADPLDTIRSAYDAPLDPERAGDEFVPPTQIVDDAGTPIGPITDGDSVIFFNFRGDRPREISKAFVLDDDAWATVQEGGFDRGPRLTDLYFVGMTNYERGLPLSAIGFEKPDHLPDILGETITAAGLSQFRCAETEKFPHVTFFFNDYREDPFEGERRVIVQSPKDVATYDLKPEMSAAGVLDAVLATLADEATGEPVIIVNFANGDMVGHTGKLDAATRAVEVVDAATGAIIDATLARDGALIIAADHGNAEQMWDPDTGSPQTAHTVYDVPLTIIGNGLAGRTLRSGGRLADIAPTMLDLLGVPAPKAMSGRSLLSG